MRFKKFDGVSWLIGFLRIGVFFFVRGGARAPLTFFSVGGCSKVFCFDVVRFYLGALSVILAVSLLFWKACFRGVGKIMISVSLLCSLLSYSCVNSLGF